MVKSIDIYAPPSRLRERESVCVCVCFMHNETKSNSKCRLLRFLPLCEVRHGQDKALIISLYNFKQYHKATQLQNDEIIMVCLWSLKLQTRQKHNLDLVSRKWKWKAWPIYHQGHFEHVEMHLMTWPKQ